MSPRPFSSRVVLRLLPFDLLFVALVPLVLGVSLRVPSLLSSTLVGVGASAVRCLLWMVLLRGLLAPVDTWERNKRGRSEELFRGALDAVRHVTGRFLTAYSALWTATILAQLAYIMTVDAPALSPRFPIAAGLIVFSIVLGSGVFAYTSFGSILSNLSAPVAEESRRRGLGALHATSSIQIRIASLAVAFALAPLGWLSAIGLVAVEDASAHNATDAARAAAMAEVAGVSADDETVAGEAVVYRLRAGETSQIPSDLAQWAQRDPQRRAELRLDPRLDRAAAFVRTDDGQTIVAVAAVSAAPANALLIAAACFLLVIAVWAPISSLFFGRGIADGISRVTRAAGRVVEVGDLSKMEPLPELASDELGELTTHFNTLIDRLRDIARGSLQVAEGSLDVSIDGEGELPSAFRGMLANLRDLVGQIRSTAVQLASAAAEIYSASQEQEAAASQQSAGIGEVSRTVDSLSDAAGHIAESAGAVLGDAERTRTTTDQMIARIGELNAHAGRIGELLESIREVADRSDLLALNGSLEATRAGEAGRGFALVAGEMRRLAERVTATVEDVRKLVGDIRSSGASTVMATEQSRKLAESTTDAARRISLVTQQQRTAMEQVSASVREVAEVLAQAAAATTQTRVSTEDLKSQADKLDVLLRRFSLETRTTA